MGQRGAPAHPCVAFGCVLPPVEPWLWLKARALLWPAIERGGNDAGHVEQEIVLGRAQLWMAIEGQWPIIAAVSRMDGDIFEVWLAGGPILGRGLHFLDTALEAAAQGGAESARITGRKGWRRVLAHHGWHADGEDLVKDLR